MRADWVKNRRGQPNVTQMHYARKGVVTEEMIRSMNPDPIVFAMANPVPEIWPDAAKRPW